jgi:LysR substrate binding domain
LTAQRIRFVALRVFREVAALRHTHPAITVTTREGSIPALIRALRAGMLDLALLASAPPFRLPDVETPPLRLQILTERSLRIAVPASHPLARREFADVADLHGQRWIAGSGEDLVMGVWPGLDERPDIAHTARDWLAKLHLVAARLRHHHRAPRARIRGASRCVHPARPRRTGRTAAHPSRATPITALRGRRSPRRRAPRSGNRYGHAGIGRDDGLLATHSIVGTYSPLPITSRVKSYPFAGITRLSRSSG